MDENDLEIEFLEKEFLKCGEDSIPFPMPEIKIYEEDVQEIMKSGCNLQIAEYVMLKYKELEDKESQNDKNFKKLCDLREEYYKLKNPIINKAVDDVARAVESKKKLVLNQEEKNEMKEYEEEINEILDKEKTQKLINENQAPDFVDLAEYFFKQYYDKQNKEEFSKLRNEYINKRDAVVESALRKVKKIVNDENEYGIFYKEYYGKEESKDNN